MKLNEKGSVWVVMSFLIIIVWVLLAAVINTIAFQYRAAGTNKLSTQAFHLAEAGITKALWELSNNIKHSNKEETLDTGTFRINIEPKGKQYIITSTGYLPDSKRIKAKQTIRVIAQKDEEGTYRAVSWKKF